jgi:hypothetical protein
LLQFAGLGWNDHKAVGAGVGGDVSRALPGDEADLNRKGMRRRGLVRGKIAISGQEAGEAGAAFPNSAEANLGFEPDSPPSVARSGAAKSWKVTALESGLPGSAKKGRIWPAPGSWPKATGLPG